MKKIFYLGFFFVITTGFSLCHKDNSDHHHEEEIKTYTVDDIPKDVKIPAKLWDQIEGKDLPFDPNAPVVSEDAGGFSVIYTPVEVVLNEKNEGVLSEKNVQINLPRGGGEVDLGSHIGKTAGTFYVQFHFPEYTDEDKKSIEQRVWFVSRTKKRKLGDEIVGAGCKAWFEISKKFKNENSAHGIKANTTRQRHTTLLGGSFIFSWKKNGQTYLAQVNFIDTENNQLFCETKLDEESSR